MRSKKPKKLKPLDKKKFELSEEQKILLDDLFAWEKRSNEQKGIILR